MDFSLRMVKHERFFINGLKKNQTSTRESRTQKAYWPTI